MQGLKRHPRVECNYVFELEDKVFDIGGHSLNTCKDNFLRIACHSLINLNFSIILSSNPYIFTIFSTWFYSPHSDILFNSAFLTLRDHFLA